MMCSNTNISFTSRCQSIEMARSACRKITMFSTTKNQHTVQKLKQTNREAMEFLKIMRICLNTQEEVKCLIC